MNFFEVMQNSFVSTQIPGQNIQIMVERMWLSSNSAVLWQTLVKIVLCKFIFSMHIFNAFGLTVLSYRLSSFNLQFLVLHANILVMTGFEFV